MTSTPGKQSCAMTPINLLSVQMFAQSFALVRGSDHNNPKGKAFICFSIYVYLNRRKLEGTQNQGCSGLFPEWTEQLEPVSPVPGAQCLERPHCPFSLGHSFQGLSLVPKGGMLHRGLLSLESWDHAFIQSQFCMLPILHWA